MSATILAIRSLSSIGTMASTVNRGFNSPLYSSIFARTKSLNSRSSYYCVRDFYASSDISLKAPASVFSSFAACSSNSVAQNVPPVPENLVCSMYLQTQVFELVLQLRQVYRSLSFWTFFLHFSLQDGYALLSLSMKVWVLPISVYTMESLYPESVLYSALRSSTVVNTASGRDLTGLELALKEVKFSLSAVEFHCFTSYTDSKLLMPGSSRISECNRSYVTDIWPW